jgi:uncharacterized protein (TIGR03435 family)
VIQARPKTLVHAFVCIFALPIAVSVPSASAQAAAASSAASAAPVPVYDVMSIKFNKTLSGSTSVDVDDGRFSATNVSLKNLLAEGYDIRQELISGISGPVESARFDLEAKVVDPDPTALKKMTREQRRNMLLPLLIERFQIQTHTETKTLPVYELVVAKSGSKCKPSADQAADADGDMSTNGHNAQVKITARKVTMSAFVKALSGRVDRTVIDKTGLTGNFDLDLLWTNDNNPDSGAEQLPTLFTAIQEQLGLKLQPSKGPVETLVVDHATMPSEN